MFHNSLSLLILSGGKRVEGFREIIFGFATGFLDFARNDVTIFARKLQADSTRSRRLLDIR